MALVVFLNRITGCQVENEVILTIADLVYPGRGLARLDGLVVFLRGVVPGESVRASITKRHKNYAEAEPTEILEASSNRTDAACPLFHTCPGCSYQHVTYATEMAAKQKQFVELLTRFGRVDPTKALTPIASPVELEYRNKITLHADANRKRALIGYIGYDNKTILEVPRCPLAVGPINELLIELRRGRVFNRGFGSRDQIVLRYTDHDGALHHQKSSGYSKRRLVESTLIGPIEVPLKSFFQVNRAVADMITERVIALLKDELPDWVVDLYCGAGVFTLAALQAGVTRVAAIDTDVSAVRAAEANAKKRRFAEGVFLARQASKGLEQILSRVVRSRWVLILDPPRQGVSETVIQAISANAPQRILYISCAPDSLARDIARLGTLGYCVEHAQLFDMFPRTVYFESLTSLVRP